MSDGPASLFDAVLQAIQATLGTGPLGMFLATAIASFLAAAVSVLAIRSALKKEWASIGDWMDRIVVVVAPASTDQGKLDRCYLGALPLLKGRLLLEWPDASALALAQVNANLSRVTSQGIRLANLTGALTGVLTFVTAFIVQSAVTFVLVLLEWPQMDRPLYVFALFLIFAWPGALYLFQHSTLPDWRSDLDRTEASMKKLGRQFKFTAVELA